MLSATHYGSDNGIPLLIAHGLYGSARNWGVIAKRLSDERPVIAVDMRNHGSSPWFDSHDYHDMAGDLAEVISENGGQVDLCGHSMGGKAAMVLALTHPDLLRSLIVADIAPVAYSHTQAHLITAMKSLDLSQVESRADADTLLANLVEDPGIRAFLLQSLALRDGPKHWRLNLDVLGTEMKKIMSFPELSEKAELPVLMLSGGNSNYVLPEHRERIKALFPKARFAKIPGAGHWLHADKPREFEAALRAYLSHL